MLYRRKNAVFFYCETCHSEIPNPRYKKLIRFCSHKCYSQSPQFLEMASQNGKKCLGRKCSWGDNIAKSKIGKKRPDMSGSKHWEWKGEKASYRSIHHWVERYKTKPKICPACGEEKRIEWANIDHKYRRVLSDYIPLCHRCHSCRDRARR